MKKIVAAVLLVVLVFCMVACSPVKELECLTENGRQCLVLPTSKSKVWVKAGQESYLDRIDYDLLEMADEKIADQVPEGSQASFVFKEYEESIYLTGEAIVDISATDHKHLFFSEKITN